MLWPNLMVSRLPLQAGRPSTLPTLVGFNCGRVLHDQLGTGMFRSGRFFFSFFWLGQLVTNFGAFWSTYKKLTKQCNRTDDYVI
jgi:hypothetical protein